MFVCRIVFALMCLCVCVCVCAGSGAFTSPWGTDTSSDPRVIAMILELCVCVVLISRFVCSLILPFCMRGYVLLIDL